MKPTRPTPPLVKGRPTYSELTARVTAIFASENVRQSVKHIQAKKAQLLDLAASNALIEEAINSLLEDEGGVDPLNVTLEEVETFLYHRSMSLELEISEVEAAANAQVSRLVERLQAAGIALP